MNLWPNQHALKRNLTLDRFGNHLMDISGYSRNEVEKMIKMPYLDITRMCAVTNIYLRPLYELKKAEYAARYAGCVREEIMFYTTSALHAHELARNNFNWRYDRRVGECGAGIAFSPDPEHSTTLHHSRAKEMAIVVVKVLQAKSAQGYSFMDFPPVGCDTTRNKSGKVIVKFHDHEYLPIYVVFFNRPVKFNNRY